jgi:hypothetical protein
MVPLQLLLFKELELRKNKMGDLITNHHRYQRQVIFDKKHQVTMIQSARRNPPGCTTYQIVEKNAAYKLISTFLTNDDEPMSVSQIKDIVLTKGIENFKEPKWSYAHNSRVTKGYEDFKIEIRYEAFDGFPERVDGLTLSRILLSIPEEVKDYLFGFNPANSHYNLIPAGYGWDGKHTNIELIRSNRVKQLLIGEYEWRGIDETLIDRICNESLFTPNRLINTQWDKACGYEPGEKIFLTKGNEDSEVFIIGQTKDLSELINLPLIETNEGAKYFIPDERFPRHISVVTNVLHKAGHPNYGVKIRLYERIVNEHPD